jgi:AcrR family transcriptional regulator
MSPGADRVSADHRHPGATAETCRAVLRAALAVAQQRGYHGTTVARVAEAADVDPSAVTGCFPDRVTMLRAALDEAFTHWYDEVPTWKEVEPLPELRDELDRRLGRGVGAQRRAADFWRLGLLLRLEPALAESDCGELFLAVREQTRQALRDYWRRILPDDSDLGPGLVELAVRGHMSLVDGGVLASHAIPEWDLERMMRFVAAGVSQALGDAEDGRHAPR